MPVAWFRTYCTMLGRLQAEDSLRLVQAVGLGFGGGGDQGKAYIKELSEIADGGRKRKRKPTYANPRAVAQAAGINVIRERSVDRGKGG